MYDNKLKLESINEEKRAAIFTTAFQSFAVTMCEDHAVAEATKIGRRLEVHEFDASEIARDAVRVVRDEIRAKCAEMIATRQFYVGEYLSRFQNPLIYNSSKTGNTKEKNERKA